MMGSTEEEFRLYPRSEPPRRFNACSTFVLDLENEDDVICIGSTTHGTVNSSMSSKTRPMGETDQSILKKKVTFADDDRNDDEIEWIISPGNRSTARNICNPSSRSKVSIFTVKNEIGDGNYFGQVETFEDSNVIDVERPYISNYNGSLNSNARRFVDFYHLEDEIGTAASDSISSSPATSSELVVNAIVHADPSKPFPRSTSPIENIEKSEIDDYDARVRASFGLDFSVETESKAVELNQTTNNVSMDSEVMECDSEGEVIDIEDDSDDDCVITNMEINISSDTKPNNMYVSSDTLIDDVKVKERSKKVITETVDEIFKRMMPSAIPGALSLFAPERHCLPKNVRPSKFCYYYFISSYIVVKEIAKQEFYKFKEQVLVAKKSHAPPRCNCLSHPLNQNASKLTLLTNPYSLYHKPNCHFSQNTKQSSTRKKRPRRLSYLVSLHQIPRKPEGKDFKNWSDTVIRRKLRTSNSPNSTLVNWSCGIKENTNSIQHRSISGKNEPIESNAILSIPSAIKTES